MKSVLCLHGIGQRAAQFRIICKDLVKTCIRANFLFAEGTLDHNDGKSWYPITGLLDKRIYSKDEMDGAFKLIDKMIIDNNCTAVIGFSQGGSLLDAYLNHHSTKYVSKAIFISSFSYPGYTTPIKSVKAMNVIGKRDLIVPEKYKPYNYENIKTIYHPGGHIFPGGKVINEICDFLVE